jgi:hypothetical protein
MNRSSEQRDLPLVRVKMTPRGPHVLAGDEHPDDGQEELCAGTLSTQANRDILPMSTGVPILPTQSAQITWPRSPGRPQARIYKSSRFIISNAGTAGGAADWIVKDIKIAGWSQFLQSGDMPGAVFAADAPDDNKFVRFAPLLATDDVVVVVTYIGLNECGCPFFGTLVSTVVNTGAAEI